MSALTTAADGTVDTDRRRRHDARTFWRVLLAVAAPVGGLSMAAGDLLAPSGLAGTGAETVTGIAAHQALMGALAWTGPLINLTMITGAIAVAWVCRLRAPILTAVAGAVVVGGFLSGFTSANNALNIVTLVGVQHGVDSGALATLIDQVNSNAIVGVSLIPMLLAITVGRILLGVALWRVAVAPRWMAAALIAAPLVEFFNFNSNNVQPAVGWALTAIGFTSATVALLRTRNDDFDLPPLR